MDSPTNETFYKVVKMARALLERGGKGDRSPPSMIVEKIDQILSMKPSWRVDLNIEAAVAELVRRFSVWVGESAILRDDSGHKDWLVASRKQNWRYWQRYRDWLEAKLPSAAIDELDRTTDDVLGLLEDPIRIDAWDRRGLVVGHVPVWQDRKLHRTHLQGRRCWLQDHHRSPPGCITTSDLRLRCALTKGFWRYETAPNPEDLALGRSGAYRSRSVDPTELRRPTGPTTATSRRTPRAILVCRPSSGRGCLS